MNKKRFVVTLAIRSVNSPKEFFVSVYSLKLTVVCITGEEAISAAFGLVKTPEAFYVHSLEMSEVLK